MYEEWLDVPADPIALVRRLSQRAFSSVFWSNHGTLAYVACDPIEHASSLDPEPSLALGVRSPLHSVPRWVGLLPYECRRGLEREGQGARRGAPHVTTPHWVRYAAVAVIASGRVRVVGEAREPVQTLAARLRAVPPAPEPVELERAADFEAAEVHGARIRRALEHIRAGDLYQVNLARRFELHARARAWDLLERLQRRGSAPHSAAFDWGELRVASISPELFLSLDTSGALLTSPIKGTRPRGESEARNQALARELDADPKERAELTMVLDVERNDLARLARPGSVQLVVPPHVEPHGTVLHRVATLRAEQRPGVTRTELLERMLPSGSVTGAPKVRAMDLIAELEAERRGLYTGAFGYLAHDGSLELGMAIRTLTVRAERGHYWAGGGIVADSDPEREVQETLWKAEALLSALAKN
jgi:anthranilate/para-aminobenzoate synthase component I